MELWVHGLPKGRSFALETLKDLGISNVVLSAKQREAIEQAVEAGLSVYPCTHAYGTRREDPEDLLCLTIEGDRKKWFYSNCPNQPRVQERHLETIEELAGIPGIKGVFVDGARFASPASGIDAFFTCFCSACRTQAEVFGLDFDRIRRDVASLYNGLHQGKQERFAPLLTGLSGWPSAGDLLSLAVRLPGVFDWFRLRALSTAKHVRDVRKTLKASNPGLVLGMYVFTPSLSGLVGQVYSLLAEHVDIISPMIYRNGPADSIAPLNSELARMWTDLSKATGLSREDAAMHVLRFAGYDSLLAENSPDVLAEALPPLAVGRETASARLILGSAKRLVPIIWLNDDEIERSVGAVQRAGADGVNFFTYRDGSETLLGRAAAVGR